MSIIRKEITFALILGILLGGIIIYGLKLANQASIDQTASTVATTTPTLTPTPTPDLQILQPEDHTVSLKDTINLQGKSKPNSLVAIIYEQGEDILQADENGHFTLDIDLAGGENQITITSTDGQQYQESLELTIVYTTADINQDQDE